MIIPSLHGLPTDVLRVLGASLQSGRLSLGVSRMSLAPIVGSHAVAVGADMERLAAQGFTPAQIGLLVQSAVETRESGAGASDVVELVMSGPEVSALPMGDTASAIMSLVGEARSEVLLVGYAVHQGHKVFECMANRIAQHPDLRIILCLDIGRRQNDTSLESEIVRRFAGEFQAKQWPWPQLPQLFYDPRSLSAEPGKRSSLHAKCVVVDRRVAFVTSANFTEAAQERNIELGALVRHEATAARIDDYFLALRTSGQLRQCHMP